MADTQTAPEKGVASRAETVRQERRKKPGQTAHPGIHLSVDESKLDRKTYQYRFVNDQDNRVQRLEAQDWDVAPEGGAKPDSNSVGTLSSAHAGLADGKPYNTVLMRKRKDWFETDQKEKQQPLDAIETAIKRGNPNHSGNDLKGAGVYTPGADESNPSGVNIFEKA